MSENRQRVRSSRARHSVVGNDDDVGRNDGFAVERSPGIHMGLLEDLTIATVNDLFLKTQPAHPQKITGNHLDSEERNAAAPDAPPARPGAHPN